MDYYEVLLAIYKKGCYRADIKCGQCPFERYNLDGENALGCSYVYLMDSARSDPTRLTHIQQVIAEYLNSLPSEYLMELLL